MRCESPAHLRCRARTLWPSATQTAQAQEANVFKRRKVKRSAAGRTPLNIATQGNEVWSMDFVSDGLANGWRLKCLTGAHDFSRACVDLAVDYGISDMYMTRRLDRVARFRDYPASVRIDYGPEFTCRSFPDWVFQRKPASRSETKPPQALVSRSRDATHLEVRLVERWETGRRPEQALVPGCGNDSHGVVSGR